MHINQLTLSCYYQLRQLRTVSRSLSHGAAATLVHAFVTNRLDHCSSVLVGLPPTMTARLDRVLRSAARLIGGVPKYASISSYMRDTLHWLPIRQRIFYGVAVLVWHCLIGFAPVYLQELCRPGNDPGWPSSASILFWWQTLSSPCKHLDYAASCILSSCSFYLEFTSLANSVVTKELHAFDLQAA